MKNLVYLCVATVLVGASVVASACSSDSTRPPLAGQSAIGVGGGVTTGNPDVDSGSDIPDGGDCLTGTFQADIDTALGGANEIGGQVAFSTTVAASHSIQLTITSVTGSPTFTNAFTFPGPLDNVTFRLRSIPDGTYTLLAQADIAGTSGVSDVGDLKGYYNGTTITAITSPSLATDITVPACVGGLDFGIAPNNQ